VRLTPLVTSATNWPIEFGVVGEMRIGRELETWLTTNPKWPDLDSNPDRRCGKPVTKRMNYGTAFNKSYYYYYYYLVCEAIGTAATPGLSMNLRFRINS
jgi:hypothetical protein